MQWHQRERLKETQVWYEDNFVSNGANGIYRMPVSKWRQIHTQCWAEGHLFMLPVLMAKNHLLKSQLVRFSRCTKKLIFVFVRVIIGSKKTPKQPVLVLMKKTMGESPSLQGDVLYWVRANAPSEEKGQRHFRSGRWTKVIFGNSCCASCRRSTLVDAQESGLLATLRLRLQLCRETTLSFHVHRQVEP